MVHTRKITLQRDPIVKLEHMPAERAYASGTPGIYEVYGRRFHCMGEEHWAGNVADCRIIPAQEQGSGTGIQVLRKLAESGQEVSILVLVWKNAPAARISGC